MNDEGGDAYVFSNCRWYLFVKYHRDGMLIEEEEILVCVVSVKNHHDGTVG